MQSRKLIIVLLALSLPSRYECFIKSLSFGERCHITTLKNNDNNNDDLTIITPEIVRRVSDLSQLDLSDEEIMEMLPRITEFVNFAKVIREVNLDKTPPIRVTQEASQVFRNDSERSFDGQDTILANFPAEEDGYLYVPRVAVDSAE